MSKRKHTTSVARADAWVNPYRTKSRRKITSTIPIRCLQLQPQTCAAMFVEDDMAKRVVKELPEHAMRQGFTLETSGDDASGVDTKQLMRACKRWAVADKVTEADIWGRCFGGGVIFLGVSDVGLQAEPLDITKIKRGALRFLDVYDRRDVVPYAYYDDPTLPNYGEPELYRIQTYGSAYSTMPIHESRLIRFGGVLTSRIDRIENGGWDFSVLQHVFSVLQQSEVNWQAIGALMADFAQGVFKIKDLVKILAQNEAGTLENRMSLMDQTRASDRAIVLDADKEDFERKATPVAGAAELLDRTWQRVAAAAEMPVTVLMGTSPAGLNATGDSDIRLWYDRVHEHREKVIAPRLMQLIQVIAANEGIAGIDDIDVCWPSLWQMTPTEEATYRKTIADTDKIYVDMQAVLPEEIALSRWGGGTYSTHMTIDLEARRRAAQAEVKQLVAEAGKTEAVPPAAPSTKPVPALVDNKLDVEAAPAPAPETRADEMVKVTQSLVNARLAGVDNVDAERVLAAHNIPIKTEG